MTSDIIVAGDLTIPTADLYDAHHARLQVCILAFRSFGRRLAFCGPCVTLRCFEDHTPVLACLQEPGAGRVLVVDAGGSLRVGVMGDRLAAIAVASGWTGVIINGAIRDSMGIDALALGVKALGTTARRGWAPNRSAQEVPLEFGEMAIRSGDWIYADPDCVICSAEPLTAI